MASSLEQRMMEMNRTFIEAFLYSQDLLLWMHWYQYGANFPVELRLPPEETAFADVALGLDRVREGAAFPQLRTSVQARGHSWESLCCPAVCTGTAR